MSLHPTLRRKMPVHSFARLAILGAAVLTTPILATSLRAAEGVAGTKPAVLPPASAPNAPRVLVLSFDTIGKFEGDGQGTGIGRAIATDLAGGPLEPMIEASSASDAAGARQRGRDAGAKYVVFGTVQSFGGEVRIAGQALEVDSGRSVGALKATGPQSSFFQLQDRVGEQAKQALNGSSANAPAANGSTPVMAARNDDSHWGQYSDWYEQPSQQPAPATPAYPPYPPTPPPPMYNAYFNNGYGGGSYAGDPGSYVVYPGSFPQPRGVTNTTYYGQIGTSNAPQQAVPNRAVPGASIPNNARPVSIPAYNPPIQAYKPLFAKPGLYPGGAGTRARTPVLRPGATN